MTTWLPFCCTIVNTGKQSQRFLHDKIEVELHDPAGLSRGMVEGGTEGGRGTGRERETETETRPSGRGRGTRETRDRRPDRGTWTERCEGPRPETEGRDEGRRKTTETETEDEGKKDARE